MTTIETKKYIHEALNDPKIFKKDSFRTVIVDDKTSIVYGIKEKDGKEAIHKILIKK
jgi:hypothetical protein